MKIGSQVGCLIAFVGLMLWGCKQGAPVISLAAIKPDSKIPRQAKLVMMGTVMMADIVQKNEGEKVQIEVVAHGEVLEHEVYEMGGQAFRLVEAGGEMYSPPIPILIDPLPLGQTWKWKGTMSFAGAKNADTAKQADASIMANPEKLNVSGGPFDSYKVSLNLRISDGSPTPSKRELRFWFVPGKGVVKREFDYSSLREPDQRGPQ